MALLRKVAYERNQSVVKDALEQLQSKYPATSNPWVGRYLIRKLHKWSVFFAPRFFFGLSITTSPTQKLNDRVKDKLPNETTIPKIINQVEKLNLQYQKTDVKVEKTFFTKVFGDARICDIQRKLGSKVFFRLMKHYVASFGLTVFTKDESTDPINYKLKTREGHVLGFTLNYRYCPCGLKYQEGLPCQHMLAVFRADRSIQLESIINPRWIISSEEPEEIEQTPKERRGRPRISRRNVLK